MEAFSRSDLVNNIKSFDIKNKGAISIKLIALFYVLLLVVDAAL